MTATQTSQAVDMLQLEREMDEMVAANEQRQEREAYEAKMARDAQIERDHVAAAAVPLQITGAGAVRQPRPGDASQPQQDYIDKLLAARVVPDEVRAAIEANRAIYSKARAHAVIDRLKAMPFKQTSAQAEPGYYVQGDQVFVVVWNKQRTRTYAKKLVVTSRSARWQYAPGNVATLAELTPLTVDEARRLGHLHGVCVICAKQLTDPVSVNRGIGPVCEQRLTGRSRSTKTAA